MTTQTPDTGSAEDRVPPPRFHREEDGAMRVEIAHDGRCLSRLGIIPLTVTIGVARVRVDGIAGVETVEDARRRGLARRIMEAAVAGMRTGTVWPADPAALSILFGVPDFYERFGYAPAGPDPSLALTDLARASPLAAGWTVRPGTVADLPAMQALYARSTDRSVGAAVRPPGGRVWAILAAAVADPTHDECRVVVDPHGAVAAYVWRARDSWAVDPEEEFPRALTVGEAIAVDPVAADALLAGCRAWAVAESAHRPGISCVRLAVPPDGTVCAAATRQDATLTLRWRSSGGFMGRTLDVRRLLEALVPELSHRVRASAVTTSHALRIATELGRVTLDVSPHGVSVRPRSDGPGLADAVPTIELPQDDLARLALGTFPPDDVCDRLRHPPDARTRQVLALVFPQRSPFMYRADQI